MSHATRREEQALREVGHTDISQQTAWWMIVVFLSILLCVPAIQWWLDLRSGQKPAIAEVSNLLARGLPEPTEISAFERDVENRDWLRQTLLGPSQAFLLELGAGNERTLVGLQQWLFYNDSVKHLTGPSYLDPARQKLQLNHSGRQLDSVSTIRHFHEQLQARGIQLVLVPVPVKAAIYPDKLSRRFESNPNPLRHSDDRSWYQVLESDGIVVIDSRPALAQLRADEPTYLSADTHWSPAGMAAVADLITKKLFSMGIEPGDSGFREIRDSLSNVGDLAVMLALDDPSSFNEGIEHRGIYTRAGQAWTPNRDAEILLLGDSYTNIFSMEGLGWGSHGGLAEQLSFQLDKPLDRIAINDNGSFSTREALVRDMAQGDDRLAGKKVVIWQFSERELSLGDWRPIDLPEPGNASRDVPVFHQPIEATVLAVSRAPKPGSVPYRDSIVALAVQPLGEQNPVLVYDWGMRDNQPARAAHYRPGDRLRLELLPWREAEAEVGGYQRNDLTESAYLRLQAYWASRSEPLQKAGVGDEPVDAPAIATKTPGESNPFAQWLAGVEKSPGCEAIAGKGGWNFFLPELRHLASGPFWGEAAAGVSKADPENADPLDAILDFAGQLRKRQISLILVPVPAKARIYPEYLPAEIEVPSFDRDFHERLGLEGIEVLDVERLFLANKEGSPLFLKTDTHWSPKGIDLVSDALAAKIRVLPDLGPEIMNPLSTKKRALAIQGDLSCVPDTTGEEVTLTLVKDGTGRRAPSPKPDRNSPVLLMGDSHTLVFHSGGDLFARGAGLPELLHLKLGYAVDLIGVRGSGATTVRLDVMRRGDQLAGKKVVVWVYTVREYTESVQGWAKTTL